ncbi:MAG: DUF2799 domain-containing protein [Pseudomonadota bacterium]
MKPLLIIAALSLGACAAAPQLSAAQCDADWYAVGAADAEDGAPATKIEQYREACANGGAPLTSAEIDDWFDGYGVVDQAAIAPDYETHSHSRHTHYPRVRPNIGIGVGIGSRGVRTSVGAGVSVGILSLGIGLGF